MKIVTKAETMRFICDDNLGKLARYLRVGGFDTAFERTISDSRLIQIALSENRAILTRDTRLIKRTLVREFFLIVDDNWRAQLSAVATRYNLKYERAALFSRCLEDNFLTEQVAKSDIKDRVFPYTYDTVDSFRQCPHCRRVYWAGTHVSAMLNKLSEAGIKIID